MNSIDLTNLQDWIGNTETSNDVLAARHGRLLAATLDRPPERCIDGMPLPPLWHWCYFLDALPESQLGRDGHPARGGFLPPVPLPNRMWAGGRLEFHAPRPFGAAVERRSCVASVEHKRGRSGDLVFVTVRHQIFHQGQLALTEYHDIVYKEAAAARGNAGGDGPTMPTASHRRDFRPSSTTLFRYSALTFNGHRIHYDADYCRTVEGYDNLVIHGPLTATMLAGFAEELGGRPLKAFRYRGLRPAPLGASLTLNAAPHEDGLQLWSALPDGTPSMLAYASF